MLIREDLHTGFDRREFVFVPKAEANEAPVFVTHLLTDSPELGLLYHNTKLHPIDRAAPSSYLLGLLGPFSRALKVFY